MIKVNVKTKKGIIEELSIYGHALYDDVGHDIVCAGVSASLITTVNAIISFDEESITYKESNNFKLINLKQDDITNTLLNNLVNILKEIEQKYSKNIKVKEENYE